MVCDASAVKGAEGFSSTGACEFLPHGKGNEPSIELTMLNSMECVRSARSCVFEHVRVLVQ